MHRNALYDLRSYDCKWLAAPPKGKFRQQSIINYTNNIDYRAAEYTPRIAVRYYLPIKLI